MLVWGGGGLWGGGLRVWECAGGVVGLGWRRVRGWGMMCVCLCAGVCVCGVYGVCVCGVLCVWCDVCVVCVV